MALDRLTKIDGGGISTTSDYRVGVITATKFVGPIEGTITSADANFTGNVTIGGTLTYEDVTNVDSVGIVTAQKDVHVGAGLSVVGVTTLTGRIFAGGTSIPGYSGADDLTIGSETGHHGITIRSGADKNGGLFFSDDTSGGSNANQWAGGIEYNHPSAELRFYVGNSWRSSFTGAGHYIPYIDSSINIGSSSKRFANVYSDNLNLSANATITGDLDVDGHTNLDNVSVAGVTTFASHAYFGDNDKLYFGASASMDIFQTGAYGYIRHNSLVINSNDLIINATNSHNLARFSYNSDVELYFANSKKFNTTNTGINVTGNTVADGLVIDGDSDLNGDLDVDGHTNLDNVSIAGITTYSKSGSALRLNDGSILRLGNADADFFLYHDGNNIDYISAGATKQLRLTTDDFIIKGANNTETLMTAAKDGPVHLYHNNISRLSTSSVGVSISQDLDVDGHTNLDNVSVAGVSTFTGTLNSTGGIILTGNMSVASDTAKVFFGASNDLSIFHDGSHSYIDDTGTGNLYIQSNHVNIDSKNGEQFINCIQDGAIELYHDNVLRLKTHSFGTILSSDENLGRLILADTSGNFGYQIAGYDANSAGAGGRMVVQDADGAIVLDSRASGNNIFIYNTIKLNGNATADNLKLIMGAGEDLQLYHNGSNSFIQHLGTGGLYIDALNNSADIIFRSQDNINFYTNAASQSAIDCVGNGGVILYNQGNARFNTDADGAVVTEKRLAINRNAGDPYLQFQTSGTTHATLYGGASTGFRVFTGSSQTERLRIRADGKVLMGAGLPTSGYTNSYLHVEGPGVDLRTDYDTDDNQGLSPHLTLVGSNAHVRLDMGTLDVGPYATYIQSRYDNDPEETGTSNSGLEPLMLNPMGGAVGFNITTTGSYSSSNFNSSQSTYGGIILRAGRANSATVHNSNTAIKIYPAETRTTTVGEQNQGVKFGGIAWHGLDPHHSNGSWSTGYTGHHCWMGMSYHSTPGQEFSNWQVQMNDNSTPGSFATNVALQASPQGYVTKPKQPIFLAHKISGNRITSTGYVVFGNPHINVGSHYDSSNGRFTAPIAGHYFFYCKINAYNRMDYQLRVNGRTTDVDREYGQFATDSDSVGWWSNIVQRIFYLDKNEYVQVYISSISQNSDPGSWNTFGGWLVA